MTLGLDLRRRRWLQGERKQKRCNKQNGFLLHDKSIPHLLRLTQEVFCEQIEVKLDIGGLPAGGLDQTSSPVLEFPWRLVGKESQAIAGKAETSTGFAITSSNGRMASIGDL